MSDTVEKVIPKKELLSLVRKAVQTKKKTSSIAGELGESVKYAVENKHLNKKAFSLIVSTDQMDELKRNDFWRSVDIYREMMAEEWGDGADMLDKSGADEAGKADLKAEAEAQVASNVRALKRGIKKLDDEKPAGLPGAPAESTAIN